MNGFNPEAADTKRAETTAGTGIFLHLVCAVVLLIMSFSAEGLLYSILWIQCGAGLLFFLASYLHLRFRRLAVTEQLDRESLERKRKSQGLGSLFSADDVPPAKRNLQHFNRFFAPALSIIYALILLLPAIELFYGLIKMGTPLKEFFFSNLPRAVGFHMGVIPLIIAFVLFILGAYSSGLCRVAHWRPIRAGAGYALSSAAVLGLVGICVLLSSKIGFYPERIIILLTVIGMSLLALEIIANVVLDHYRPRLPDIEQRPAYDSRLSGILAEPQGVFKTFAHTLDYQFGFSVSDTWFFRFIERAFAPLILVVIVSFYLLSSFVLVRPGQAAIIERFGKPRFFYTGAEKDWETFAAKHPPLSEGLHFKWPWPIEKSKIINRTRLSLITLGFGTANEEQARQKAEELRTKLAQWDKQHIEDENLYLMPLPSVMQTGSATQNQRENYVFISGSFTVEFAINNNADVYRYAYSCRDPQLMMRAIAENEITKFLAGADFWKVMANQTEQTRLTLVKNISDAVKENKLGVEVVNVGINNFHPPAGEVGAGFLKVITSQQDKKIEVYGGEIKATTIIGMAPSQAGALTTDAEIYKFRREQVSAAEADWFKNQLTAFGAAPEIYPVLKRMQMLEKALSAPRKIILPESATMIMDDSKAADPDSINSILAREINKLNK